MINIWLDGSVMTSNYTESFRKSPWREEEHAAFEHGWGGVILRH